MAAVTMYWFKVYTEARNDAKLRALSDAEHRIWFNLLCYAAEHEAGRGTIEDYDIDLLAIEVSNGDTDLLEATLTRLVKLRVISHDADCITFLKFQERQARKKSDEPDASRERVTRYRERKKQDGNALHDDGNALQIKSNADVTRRNAHRVDKNREEEDTEQRESTPAQTITKPVPKPKPTQAKATAIPDLFPMTDEMRAWARSAGYVPTLDLDKHHRAFIVYWTEGEGQGVRKKNWRLTWENWMEREAERLSRYRRNGSSPPVATADEDEDPNDKFYAMLDTPGFQHNKAHNTRPTSNGSAA